MQGGGYPAEGSGAGEALRLEEVAARLGRISNASGAGWGGVWLWVTRKFGCLPHQGPFCLSWNTAGPGPNPG